MTNLIKWWNSLCIFHQWSEWTQYSQQMTCYPGILNRHLSSDGYKYIQEKQKRFCQRCGKKQVEDIN